MHTVKSTFTLPDNITNELNDIAAELGEKKSRIVANALDMYFDHLDLKIAKQRSEAIKRGEVQTLSGEEMRAELGL
jgi:predicted DNA-binding protein